MCIMAGPAKISSTSILVALSKNGAKRQLTVYGMTWDSAGSGANALILAVPAKADEVELVDLSGHPKIFGKLHDLFTPPDGVLRGDRRLSFGGDTKSYIQVRDVGSYKVSVAPSYKDLDLINPELLTITKEAKEALLEYATGEFCFLVAVLQDRGKIHPLAYIHPVNEHGVFAPTKHEHGDGDGTLPEWDRSDGDGTLPKWDHSIYVVGKAVNRHALFGVDVSALSGLRREKIPARWSLPPSAMPSSIMGEFLPADETVTLFTVDGFAPNHDLWL